MKNATRLKYLFGPVPSRRFGRSLGVDLLTPKTCTLDCPFCEVGRTTCLTLERKEYAPMDEVLRELSEWFSQGAAADVVTLAGSGEPTLHLRFGEVLDAVRAAGKVKSAILTNSTLMPLPEVRHAAAKADLVKATLSAWDQASFERLTRPHPGLKFEAIMDGLRRFREEFSGAMWLEVFVLPQINSTRDQLTRVAALARELAPARIQLNTAVRPTAEQGVAAVSPEELESLCDLFQPRAEIIARFAAKPVASGAATPEAILAMLERRPCTAEDVAHSFHLDPARAVSMLAELTQAGRIRSERRGDKLFYFAGAARG